MKIFLMGISIGVLMASPLWGMKRKRNAKRAEVISKARQNLSYAEKGNQRKQQEKEHWSNMVKHVIEASETAAPVVVIKTNKCAVDALLNKDDDTSTQVTLSSNNSTSSLAPENNRKPYYIQLLEWSKYVLDVPVNKPYSLSAEQKYKIGLGVGMHAVIKLYATDAIGEEDLPEKWFSDYFNFAVDCCSNVEDIKSLKEGIEKIDSERYVEMVQSLTPTQKKICQEIAKAAAEEINVLLNKSNA